MKHTYWQRQHDSMQCDIACLAMLCRHYGRKYSLETLSRYCFATTESVSMLGISEATGNSMLQTRGKDS
ncbi:cysteine peptidase family C39 domain-containing protein [Palleniella muris]|uniref:cysteine peptidase family C39 domain-containing protein n=1 Tax=Palleniella muris TaxID=3038145 RepID=UPI00240FCC74|nr:cysteine peptidase family C39 domain-containing protein [Palleniella muris]